MVEQAVKERLQEESTTLVRILRAASEEFADHGFAGARTERIARRAGVNKAALYYHVGGKEALYLAVLEEVFSDLGQGIEDAVGRAATPEEKLEAFIMSLARVVMERKHFSRILVRELASGFGNMPAEVIGTIEMVQDTFTGILEEGKRLSVFRADFDPRVGYTMILGGLHFMKMRTSIADRLPGSGFTYGPGHQPPLPESVGSELAMNMLRAMELRP